MNRMRTLAAIAALLSSASVLAQSQLQPQLDGRLAAFASLGGGGALAGSEFDGTRAGFFDAELGLGWELPQGFRPELAALVGTAPRTYLGLRPGVRYRMDGMPLFLRAAFDFAAPKASWRFRWVLVGGGAEVRFTDIFGAYGEADLGIPLASKAGFGFAFRAGMSFKL